jgi:aminopeptidase N
VYETALKLDSLKNTHAIEVEVYDPAEIDVILCKLD